MSINIYLHSRKKFILQINSHFPEFGQKADRDFFFLLILELLLTFILTNQINDPFRP